MELAAKGTKSLPGTEELLVNNIEKHRTPSTSTYVSKLKPQNGKIHAQMQKTTFNPVHAARSWTCFKCKKVGHSVSVCKQDTKTKILGDNDSFNVGDGDCLLAMSMMTIACVILMPLLGRIKRK